MSEDRGIMTRKKIYDFMVQYIKENSYSPTLREICYGTGLRSVSTVHEHLVVLDRQGKINLGYGLVRATTIPGLKGKEYERGYNQAIEDFTERLSQKIKSKIDDCADELKWIDEIAECMKNGSKETN